MRYIFDFRVYTQRLYIMSDHEMIINKEVHGRYM